MSIDTRKGLDVYVGWGLMRFGALPMSFVEEDSALWKAVAGIVEDEGLEIYDLEYSPGGKLRVFIEGQADLAEAGQGGVKSDDCSRILRRLLVFFSVEGPRLGLREEPQIEVSSPGVNRRLRLQRHFIAACGERVKMSFVDLADDRKTKTLLGTLSEVEEGKCQLLPVDAEMALSIPIENIGKARVEFDFTV